MILTAVSELHVNSCVAISGGGGALFLNASKVSAYSCDFRDNEVRVTSGAPNTSPMQGIGGAAYILVTEAATFTDCRFIDNGVTMISPSSYVAFAEGGGMSIHGTNTGNNSAWVLMRNSSFVHNTASIINVDECSNSTSGALQLTGGGASIGFTSAVMLFSSTFQNNTILANISAPLSAYGAGLFVIHSYSLVSEKAIFEGNGIYCSSMVVPKFVEISGGGYRLQDIFLLSMSSTSVKWNSIDSYGDEEPCSTIIPVSSSASGAGGAIVSIEKLDMNALRATSNHLHIVLLVERGSVRGLGSGLYVAKCGSVMVYDSYLQGNGIFLGESNRLTSSTEGTGEGAGAAIAGAVSVLMQNVIFSYNSIIAERDYDGIYSMTGGGLIAYHGVRFQLVAALFEHNSIVIPSHRNAVVDVGAAVFGGAFATNNMIVVHVVNTTARKNSIQAGSAQGSGGMAEGGGAVLSQCRQVIISNSSFIENEAQGGAGQTGGGGFCYAAAITVTLGHDLQMHSCNFSRNACRAGAAVEQGVGGTALGGAALVLGITYVTMGDVMFTENSVVGGSSTESGGEGDCAGLGVSESERILLNKLSFLRNSVAGGQGNQVAGASYQILLIEAFDIAIVEKIIVKNNLITSSLPSLYPAFFSGACVEVNLNRLSKNNSMFFMRDSVVSDNVVSGRMKEVHGYDVDFWPSSLPLHHINFSRYIFSVIACLQSGNVGLGLFNTQLKRPPVQLGLCEQFYSFGFGLFFGIIWR